MSKRSCFQVVLRKAVPPPPHLLSPCLHLSFTMSETWLRIVDRLQFEAKNALDLVSGCLCAPSSSIKINGRGCQYACPRPGQRALMRAPASQNRAPARRGRLLVRVPRAGRDERGECCCVWGARRDARVIEVRLARVRAQEDTLSDGLGGRTGGHGGGGGVPTVQVRTNSSGQCSSVLNGL
jgi:hypothetical protein